MAGLGWALGAQALWPCPDWFHFQTRRSSLLRAYGSMEISSLTISRNFIHFIHGPRLRCVGRDLRVFIVQANLSPFSGVSDLQD